ncbi:DUF1048 domain-containing protein [Kribbella italica]|uniref:DNA-binding ferritin-like protein (Dps family) n=1 Tax=Kribbella italica TaxID=1540520 RepID=A0A7W9J5R6_9ACTN|nr:DUF1048 domain-containing protein [Kribbella italica]MBB5835895.1 DNA-binding ferritin-like protein (Dps family) [Kribbella italica]
MVARWIESLTGALEQKKEYRRDKARLDALPEPYRSAAAAMHRYLNYCGGIVDGETLIAMIGDLADLWERAAADGTPLREIVGADPVEFAEAFAQAYEGQHWIDKERARLTEAIDRAEREEGK